MIIPAEWILSLIYHYFPIKDTLNETECSTVFYRGNASPYHAVYTCIATMFRTGISVH